MEFSITAEEERCRQWYPTIFPQLSSTRSWGQQPEQGHPDFNLHGNFFVFWSFPGSTPEEAVPGPSNTDAGATSAGSPRCRAMAFPSCSDGRAPYSISKGAPHHPAEGTLAACMWYLVLSAMIHEIHPSKSMRCG